MFTGIVEAIGVVAAMEPGEAVRPLKIRAPRIASELSVGDSIAVDGACLTVVEVDREEFQVEVIGTTLARTVAADYETGTAVNLERALAVGGRLDGHLVQGHVDGTAVLRSREKDGEFWLLEFRLPEEVARFTVSRGSITINGISLTVSALIESDLCQVGVIPHTWEHTNLSEVEVGGRVNVEADLIGRYVLGRSIAFEQISSPGGGREDS